MDFVKQLEAGLSHLDPRLARRLEGVLRRIPFVRKQMQQETEALLDQLEPSLKPYRDELPATRRLPESGRPRAEVLTELEKLSSRETPRWKEGFASGAVYHGDDAHVELLNRVYALYSQSNPLHPDLWPSTNKLEAEVVAMTGDMLHADVANRLGSDRVCGTVTSGGTESIFLAMKTYRDWACRERGIAQPEIVAPVTAHAAFDKAAEYLGVKLVKVPVDVNFRADVRATGRALSRNTAVVVGSAPSFPHGTLDPILELSELARRHGAGFHTDACLGGFLLPWAQKLGRRVPDFDFTLPGVTSMSCDTHKYGFAAKGTSVVLYRSEALRHHQFYAATDWPGGLYFSPTLAGSRPGALIAAAWAALVTTGQAGYLDATRRILEAADRIQAGIRAIPELRVLGDPLFVIAFASDAVDVYRILDFMSHRRWSLNGLHKPPALHLCVTLRHTEPGVVDRFLSDLQASVAHVRGHPPAQDGMAPAYGMAANFPLRGVVADLLKGYLDRLYRP
jgi:glutamate/tyrosine decarboxylase-like PLP-dependent enzyme